MNIIGVDCGHGPISTNELAAHSLDFVARYIGGGGTIRPLTRLEAENYGRANQKIVTRYYRGNQRSLDGKSAAQVDINSASQQATIVGQPADTPIYFDIDVPLEDKYLDHVLDYVLTLQENTYRYEIGVFGHSAVLHAVRSHLDVKHLWQSPVQEMGKLCTDAVLRSTHSYVVVDNISSPIIRAYDASYGQWVPGEPAVSAKDITPTQQDLHPAWPDVVLYRLPTLHEGMQDPIDGKWMVRRAQVLLQMIYGFHISMVPASGEFDTRTTQAVRNFQASQDITVDGIVGPQTWSHLITGVNR